VIYARVSSKEQEVEGFSIPAQLDLLRDYARKIMHRDSDELKDPIAHVILNVKDMAPTVSAVKATGGSMAGDPRRFGNTGIVIGIAIDPAGNRLELIQRP
jgi:hypothetical protein